MSYLAVLIANIKGIVPLTSVSQKLKTEDSIQKSEPTYSETIEWLSSKLVGTQYVITNKNSGIRTLATLKSLQFSNCQMSLQVLYQTGRFANILSTKASLEWITAAEADLAESNNAGVWLSFDRNVPQVNLSSEGETSSKDIDTIKVPVSDLEIGKRAAKAFLHLAKICKSELRKEPF